MTVEILPWDPADHLQDDEEIVAYLDAALEVAIQDDDPGHVTCVLGDIARAKGGMSKLARDTGLSRESLYKSLSGEGNPEFATVLKVVKALGLKLHASEA